MADPLALMEEAHWCGSHGIESLKNTESDTPIVEMVKMMQHGAGNIATAGTDKEAAMTGSDRGRIMTSKQDRDKEKHITHKGKPHGSHGRWREEARGPSRMDTGRLSRKDEAERDR